MLPGVGILLLTAAGCSSSQQPKAQRQGPAAPQAAAGSGASAPLQVATGATDDQPLVIQRAPGTGANVVMQSPAGSCKAVEHVNVRAFGKEAADVEVWRIVACDQDHVRRVT
jgi:hypothetical protein